MKGKNRVLEIRHKLKMTQVEFADAIEIKQPSVSSFEKQESHPSFKTSKKIVELANSRGLKITLEDVRQD